MQEAPQTHRPLLLHLAYHLLGSMAEAEDVCQDVTEHWLSRNNEAVENPKAFLRRMTVNRSLDRLRKLQQERESYIGPWLPEPVANPLWEGDLPTLDQALLLLLEQLNPVERAVYLLREVFDWEYETIGELIDKTESNCRQLLRRARQKLGPQEWQAQPQPARVEALVQAFQAASEGQDFGPLRELLQAEVTLYSDGGGKVLAARNPIYGAEACLKFFQGVLRFLPEHTRFEIRPLNETLAFLLWDGEQLHSTLTVRWSENRISHICSLRNPDKLNRLQQVL